MSDSTLPQARDQFAPWPWKGRGVGLTGNGWHDALLKPRSFIAIVFDVLPRKREIVFVSGAAELAGAGVLIAWVWCAALR